MFALKTPRTSRDLIMEYPQRMSVFISRGLEDFEILYQNLVTQSRNPSYVN